MKKNILALCIGLSISFLHAADTVDAEHVEGVSLRTVISAMCQGDYSDDIVAQVRQVAQSGDVDGVGTIFKLFSVPQRESNGTIFASCLIEFLNNGNKRIAEEIKMNFGSLVDMLVEQRPDWRPYKYASECLTFLAESGNERVAKVVIPSIGKWINIVCKKGGDIESFASYASDSLVSLIENGNKLVLETFIPHVPHLVSKLAAGGDGESPAAYAGELLQALVRSRHQAVVEAIAQSKHVHTLVEISSKKTLEDGDATYVAKQCCEDLQTQSVVPVSAVFSAVQAYRAAEAARIAEAVGSNCIDKILPSDIPKLVDMVAAGGEYNSPAAKAGRRIAELAKGGVAAVVAVIVTHINDLVGMVAAGGNRTSAATRASHCLGWLARSANTMVARELTSRITSLIGMVAVGGDTRSAAHWAQVCLTHFLKSGNREITAAIATHPQILELRGLEGNEYSKKVLESLAVIPGSGAGAGAGIGVE